jgi:transcriptional regulator with XRE-family HTH domain
VYNTIHQILKNPIYAGVSKGMVSRAESSQRGLTLEVQFRLMAALDITPAQFFFTPEEASADALLRDASPEEPRRVPSTCSTSCCGSRKP